MAIAPDELARRYPRLYHMAALGSWPNIKQHGLLSTSALLDLFEIKGAKRRQLISQHRPECVTIEHPKHGTAVVRDQKPMDDKGLERALQDGLRPRDWYEILNDKVYFWLTRERLEKLLNANAYRASRHVVLTVDSATLLAEYAGRIVLSPMNSGCTKPFPHRRGRDLFLPMSHYPFEERRTRRGIKNAIAELAVLHSVPNIVDFVLRVEEASAEEGAQILWKRRK